MYRSFLILLIFILLAGCRPAAPPVSVSNKPVSVNGVPASDAQSQPTKPVGDMGWADRVDGNVQKVKDLKGKVVILDFWATYCPPCIEEIPHLMALQAKHGPDLVVIGLNVGGDEDRPKIPEFLERLKVTYPIAYPEDALTAYVFGQQSAIPQTAVFDRTGKMIKKITGFGTEIKIELDQTIAAEIEKR
ncbi:MAG: TlpA disulfide reductase family protein [Pyrinomonadaceae bacterium]